VDADKRENQHQTPDVPATLSAMAAAGTQGLTAPCITTFHAYHHSGTRALSQVKRVVMHDTEGGTA